MAIAIYLCRNCKERFFGLVENPTTQKPMQFLPIYMQKGGIAYHQCAPISFDKATGVGDLIGGIE